MSAEQKVVSIIPSWMEESREGQGMSFDDFRCSFLPSIGSEGNLKVVLDYGVLLAEFERDAEKLESTILEALGKECIKSFFVEGCGHIAFVGHDGLVRSGAGNETFPISARLWLRESFPRSSCSSQALAIGMNPSVATSMTEGGIVDKTASKVAEALSSQYGDVFLCNLLPVFCTNSGNVALISSLVSPEVNEHLQRLNDLVLSAVLARHMEGGLISPMWGDTSGGHNKWKRSAISRLLELLAKAGIDGRNGDIQGLPNRAKEKKRFPMHPSRETFALGLLCEMNLVSNAKGKLELGFV